MTLDELTQKLENAYNEVMKIATNPEVEPAVRNFYNGKGEAYLLVLNDLWTIKEKVSA